MKRYSTRTSNRVSTTACGQRRHFSDQQLKRKQFLSKLGCELNRVNREWLSHSEVLPLNVSPAKAALTSGEGQFYVSEGAGSWRLMDSTGSERYSKRDLLFRWTSQRGPELLILLGLSFLCIAIYLNHLLNRS